MIKIDVRKSTQCNGDYSLYITFPYDEKIVNVIREFPSRYWNKTNKEWEVPFIKLGDFVSALQEYEFDITGPGIISKEIEFSMPDGFEFKTKPYEHQFEAFKYGIKNDKWLLGDEMGLGKSKESIDIAVAKKLQKGYEHCLIICGVNGLKWNWLNEIKTHSNEDSWLLGMRIKNDKFVVGSNLDKLEDLENIDNLPYFIVTNVETLRYKQKTGRKIRRGSKVIDEYLFPITEKLIEICRSKKIGMIIFDEFHKVKNPDSDQGEQILRLSAETEIAMTGTPLMNTPLDTYIILRWLGYEKHSFYQFKNHYCIMGGYGGYQVVGYKNLEELQEELDHIMLRRKKEEVLDLPEKTYINEYVEMTPKQEQLYMEVLNDVRLNADMIKHAVNPLSELIRLRQITGYTGVVSSTIKESAKMDRMEELVDEAIENGKKVVIFSNWTQMTDIIVDRLHMKGYYPAVITGQISDKFRQEQVNKFQTSDKCKVIVGTMGAMGTGITLTEGTVEIFMDEPWNMALKEQCVDRCHRIGQKNNLTIYTLMCKDTIDEKINALVAKKGLMSDVLIDKSSDMTIEEMVDYLIS